MRLWYIDKPECRHISEIMKGVSAVYQMEQEFFPYLSVDFLPNKDKEPTGILLQAGKEFIRKNYTFDSKDDIDKLRDLLWKYLLKYHRKQIPELAKDGCLTDFRKMGRNRVIQGWQAKRRSMETDVCCKIIKTKIARKFQDQLIKHEVYTLDNSNKLDRNSCKKVRLGECADNSPIGTPQYQMCVDKVMWVCDNGYPDPKTGKKTKIGQLLEDDQKMIDELRDELAQFLLNNNLRVNKRVFDDLISVGFFTHFGNRMGNKSVNFINVNDQLEGLMREKNVFSQLMEGFDQDAPANMNQKNGNSFNIVHILSVLVLIILLYFIFK